MMRRRWRGVSGDETVRLSGLALAGLVALLLQAAPALAQSQQATKGPAAFRGTFDSYKSDLGPLPKTGNCANDKIGHNNAGANPEHDYDTAPSNTVVSAKIPGPSSGAAQTGSYLSNDGYPGGNPFGLGGAKYGSSSGLVTSRRASASVKDSDTVNAPCGETDEGTLN